MALSFAPGAAQDTTTVAIIGTGNLADMLGPAIGQVGYPVVYGSRDPTWESVHALVARTGEDASQTVPRDAAALADILILAVPDEVLDDVTAGLGTLEGKILVDVSGGAKRVAPDGYLELASERTNSERIQSAHREAHVARLWIPSIVYFADPMLVGTPPDVLVAGDDPHARAAVARVIFDVGLDPWDAGPLRFSRVFDAIGLLTMVPAQQGRMEGCELKLLPSVPLGCFMDASEQFGFGRPTELADLPAFPRREPPVPCDEWRERVGRLLQAS